MKKALEELIDNYRCGHEKATINLDFQLKDPEIFADPFHLIHLVDNLISNALKYAGEKAEIGTVYLGTDIMSNPFINPIFKFKNLADLQAYFSDIENYSEPFQEQ